MRSSRRCKRAFDARRQRIIVSESHVNWVTWSGVILVAALTLLAIAFVQSGNRLAAAIALGLFASAVSCALVLIAAQDRPFNGDFRVRPDVLQQVYPATLISRRRRLARARPKGQTPSSAATRPEATASRSVR